MAPRCNSQKDQKSWKGIAIKMKQEIVEKPAFGRQSSNTLKMLLLYNKKCLTW
jgi:hypothetical protein